MSYPHTLEVVVRDGWPRVGHKECIGLSRCAACAAMGVDAPSSSPAVGSTPAICETARRVHAPLGAKMDGEYAGCVAGRKCG